MSQRKSTYIYFEVFKDATAGSFFLYMHDLVHIRVHTTTICRNLETQNLRLDTKWIKTHLIVPIPAMVPMSQETSERPRMSFSGSMSGLFWASRPLGHKKGP